MFAYLTFTLIFAFVLAAPHTVSAEMLRYTDKSGKTHFVDSLGAVPEEYRVQIEAYDVEPLESIDDNQKSAAVSDDYDDFADYSDYAGPALTQKVEFYVTSWCKYCRKLEDYFISNNVDYIKYDIEKDSRARKRYKELGGSGVPFTKVGDKVISGYKPEQVMSAYLSLK